MGSGAVVTRRRVVSDRQWREVNASRQWRAGMFGRLLVEVQRAFPGWEECTRYLVTVRGVPLEHEGGVGSKDTVSAFEFIAAGSGAYAPGARALLALWRAQ